MTKCLVTIVLILFILPRESVCSVAEIALTLLQSTQSTFSSLGDDAYSYLVPFFGQQAADPLLKTLGDGIKKISQTVANTLNAATARFKQLLNAVGIDTAFTLLLNAVGIDANLDKLFTPEGVVMVTKWGLLAFPGYRLMFLVVWLANVIRRAFCPIIFALIKVLIRVIKLTGWLMRWKKKIGTYFSKINYRAIARKK